MTYIQWDEKQNVKSLNARKRSAKNNIKLASFIVFIVKVKQACCDIIFV